VDYIPPHNVWMGKACPNLEHWCLLWQTVSCCESGRGYERNKEEMWQLCGNTQLHVIKLNIQSTQPNTNFNFPLANIPPMSHNTLRSPAYHISIPVSAAQITAAAASAPPTVACSHIVRYSVWACGWVQPLGLKWMEPFMTCGVHPSSYKPHSLISTSCFDQCKAMPPCGIMSNFSACQWQ